MSIMEVRLEKDPNGADGITDPFMQSDNRIKSEIKYQLNRAKIMIKFDFHGVSEMLQDLLLDI